MFDVISTYNHRHLYVRLCVIIAIVVGMLPFAMAIYSPTLVNDSVNGACGRLQPPAVGRVQVVGGSQL